MRNKPSVFITANFRGIKLRPEYHDGRIWLTLHDVAKALGYSSARSLNVQVKRLGRQIKPIKLQVWTAGGWQATTVLLPSDCMEIARRSRAPNRLEFFNWIDAGGLYMVESDRA